MADQQQPPTANADAIADAKISPGDEYEEIREQVGLFVIIIIIERLDVSFAVDTVPSFLFVLILLISLMLVPFLLRHSRIDTFQSPTLPAS